MSFARGLGEYGSVVFIAGNTPYETEIAPLMIMSKLQEFDYAGATSIALVMLFTGICDSVFQRSHPEPRSENHKRNRIAREEVVHK